MIDSYRAAGHTTFFTVYITSVTRESSDDQSIGWWVGDVLFSLPYEAGVGHFLVHDTVTIKESRRIKKSAVAASMHGQSSTPSCDLHEGRRYVWNVSLQSSETTS